MNSVYVLAEGGKKPGMGHIVRMNALCQLLEVLPETIAYIKTDWEPGETDSLKSFFSKIYLIKDELQALESIPEKSLVLVDGYSFGIKQFNYVRKKKQLKIIFVADVQSDVPDCDVLINHLPWIKEDAYPNASIEKKLLGTKYAILRKPFYFKNNCNDKGRILVCIGGGSLEKEITHIYEGLLYNGFLPDQIDVLCNIPVLNNIKNVHYQINAGQVYDLICNAGICLITPGNISYEVFSINKTTIMGYVSESQKSVCNQFHEMGLCNGIGAWSNANFQHLPNWVQQASHTRDAQELLFKDTKYDTIKKELLSHIL